MKTIIDQMISSIFYVNELVFDIKPANSKHTVFKSVINTQITLKATQ